MAPTQVEDVKDEVENVTDKVTGDGDGNGSGGGGGDLAKKILLPAAAGLGTLAATYAAKKAPELMRDKLKPKLEEKSADEAKKIGGKAAEEMEQNGGPMGKIVGKALGKATGGGGGGGDGGGKTRRLPIQRWTDVAAPVATVYEKWTEFEEFPKFMHRVLSVQQEEDNKLSWEEKIWFSKRQWEGEITDRRKNQLIAWKTVTGTSHAGIVSFHKLDDRLTRVMITMDFRPTGMFEKMASGLRFAKRAVQADLARFKAYVEMESAKGLEYSHEATTQDDDEGDEQGDEQEATSRAGGGNENGGDANGEESETQSKSADETKSESKSKSKSRAKNGDSNGASSDDQESAREERAQRREQRRS